MLHAGYPGRVGVHHIAKSGETLLLSKQDSAQVSLSSRSHPSPEARFIILLNECNLHYVQGKDKGGVRRFLNAVLGCDMSHNIQS